MFEVVCCIFYRLGKAISISKPTKPNLWQVIQSVLAAFIGVQSQHNRERDFEQGSPVVFFIAGILGSILFIMILVLVVSWVL